MVQLLKGLALAASFSSALALGPGSPPNTFGNSAVIDLIPDNFDKIALGGKPALVEFFAPWCGHCKTLAPVYEELAQKFAFAKDDVVIAKVDADSEKSLGKRFGVQGFPTIKFFDGKSDKPEDYNGGRDLESLSEFITKKTGVKAKKARTAPSEVEMLTDSSFKSTIGGDKDVLVAFTAPWCGRKLFFLFSLISTRLILIRLQISCASMGEGCCRLRQRAKRSYRQGRR
jgi:protein disulfide-isomerase A6